MKTVKYICAAIVLFSAGHAMADWITLDVPGAGSGGTFANGIYGNIIVGRYSYPSGSGYGGFIYNGSSYTTLDAPSAIWTAIDGVDGVNLVGGYYDGSRHHGFFYHGTTWTTLDPPGSTQASVLDISGNYLVGRYDNASGTHGFLYDRSSSSWTTLDAPGVTYTVITGISSLDGYMELVGYTEDPSGTHGFLYYKGSWTPIDKPGSTGTAVWGVDGANYVGSCTDASGNHGFLYDGSSWTTLDAPGASYTVARGIDGSNIVGFYNDSSGYHGFAYTRPEPPWSFVHITDPHIGFLDTRLNLARGIYAICNMVDPKPDFVICTGDIVDSAWFEVEICWERKVYKNYLEAIAPLDEQGIDHYEVPGNHDWYVYGYDLIDDIQWNPIPAYFYSLDLSQYNTWLGWSGDYIFEDENKRMIFIGMDSGKDFGFWDFRGTGLTDPQMGSLYSLDSSKPKVIFMHHPAVHTNQNWIIANNRDTKGGFIEYCKTNNVQLVLTGHTHEDHIFDADVEPVSPGSINYPQFIQTASVGKRDLPWLSGDSLGYRVIDVNDGKACPRATSPLPSYFDIIEDILNSHANVHVYDSSGRHVGIDDSGIPERGIKNSFYFSPIATDNGIEIVPEQIIIFDPSDNYLHRVKGKEYGTYNLKIRSNAVVFEATDIPTSPIAVHNYIIDWVSLAIGGEGVCLAIDEDNDGIFERTVYADEELTNEEFALQTETVIDFDPDVLSLVSNGKFVTVYIELPEGFDIRSIDVSSIKLNDSISAFLKPTKIEDSDYNGILDLMVKFDRQQLFNLLEPGEQIVEISGRLKDGSLFGGSDIIQVLPNNTLISQLCILPVTIYRNRGFPEITAVIRLPKGVTKEQIDIDQPLILYPGGIEATSQSAILWYMQKVQRTSIIAFFNKSELMNAVPDNGSVELSVVGQLNNGQYFYGYDTVQIASWHSWRPLWH